MKPIEGFKAEYIPAFEQLPAGGYVAVIKAAKEENSRNGAPMLSIAVDVSEGDYKGYWQRQFDNNKQFSKDAKWRGTYHIMLPDDDPNHTWKMRRFSNAIGSVEASNKGYRWDWNEKGLVGKTVGINIQEVEYKKNDGSIGVAVNIAEFIPVDIVKEGKTQVLPRRKLPESDAPAPSAYGAFTEVTDSEMPF